MQTLVISKSSASVKLEGEHLLVHDHAMEGTPPVKAGVSHLKFIDAPFTPHGATRLGSPA